MNCESCYNWVIWPYAAVISNDELWNIMAPPKKKENRRGKKGCKGPFNCIHKIFLHLLTMILLETARPPYTNYPIRSCFPWLLVAEGLSVSAIGSWRIGLAFRIARGEAGKTGGRSGPSNISPHKKSHFSEP